MAKRKAAQGEESRATKRPRQNGAGAGKPAKKVARKATSPPPSAPKAKRINKFLKNKVKQIGDFLDSTQVSVLLRTADNKNHIIVTESALIGALMSMRGDYELTDPRMASLLDVQEAIVREYQRPLGTQQVPAKHIVLDLDAATAFNDGIHLKIKGHGLEEDINLVEAELEIYHRQQEANAAARLADAFIATASDSDDELEDETASNDTEKVSQDSTENVTSTDKSDDPTSESAQSENPMKENVEKAAGDSNEDAATKQPEAPSTAQQPAEIATSSSSNKKIEAVGVCPAPIKDL